jgi:hypothetical protein
MGIFGKREPLVRQLNPDFFDEIHANLVRNGGSDSASEIAAGVATALFNTAMDVYQRSGDSFRGGAFLKQFDNRDPQDKGVADRIVSWQLLESKQNAQWINTLLDRLYRVFSQPASMDR